MVERRRGGETGVEWITSYRGPAFWEALQAGVWPRELMESALCRSHTLTPARKGFNDVFPTVDDMKRLVKDPVAYRYEHTDGLMATVLLMNGLLRDFNFAAFVDGSKKPWSTQMYLPMPDGRTTLANFFSPLNHNFEQMFLTGKETIPVERTGRDLASTRAAMRALEAGRILGIFPEGRIEVDEQLLPFQTGAALMAIKTGVPVYTAYLDGTARGKGMLSALLVPNRFKLSLGPAVDFDRSSTAREALETATQAIHQAVARLKRTSDRESR